MEASGVQQPATDPSSGHSGLATYWGSLRLAALDATGSGEQLADQMGAMAMVYSNDSGAMGDMRKRWNPFSGDNCPMSMI